MALDRVVVEGYPFRPEWKRLPEEGVDGNCAQQSNDESSKTSRDDGFYDGDTLRDE